MNKDRNQKKWTPFESLINSSEVLQELEKKKQRTTKPTLSEDELYILQQTLIQADHTKELILIDYYFKGLIYQKKGIITNIQKNDLKIYFQDHSSLYFEQIIHAKIL